MVPQTVWKIQPLTAFWGISRGYNKKLKQMGIYTIEALAHTDPMRLQKTLGVMGLQLYYHAWGLDASILSQKVRAKSKSYTQNMQRALSRHLQLFTTTLDIDSTPTRKTLFRTPTTRGTFLSQSSFVWQDALQQNL